MTTKPNEEITSVGETELATQFSNSIPRSQEPETALSDDAQSRCFSNMPRCVGCDCDPPVGPSRQEPETAKLIEALKTRLAEDRDQLWAHIKERADEPYETTRHVAAIVHGRIYQITQIEAWIAEALALSTALARSQAAPLAREVKS